MPAVRVAIVLAGGASRRFGRDKLAEAVGAGPDGATLLDIALAGLPADVEVIVVGPERLLARDVVHVREDPPGGGPAAALVAGLRSALAGPAEIIWVLPGDAPDAGGAAAALELALTSAGSVVAVDAQGRLQPLQLVLRRSAAENLVRLAGPTGAHNVSARALVEALDPPAVRHRLDPSGYADIDTPDQLRVWRAARSRAGDDGDLRNVNRA